MSEKPGSTWEPLRNATFRALWLAVLGSNVGTWMQTRRWPTPSTAAG